MLMIRPFRRVRSFCAFFDERMIEAVAAVRIQILYNRLRRFSAVR